MDVRDDLARRIRLGEDGTLKLAQVRLAGSKVIGPGREAFADELAAFANGRGGTVVLGVDDKTREIVGVPVDGLDVVEGWVREICNDVVKPSLHAEIRKLELTSSAGVLVPVIRVDVGRSLFVHRSPGGYFRRIGSSKRELQPDVLARLFQERSQIRVIRFDETPVPDTSPDDIARDLARRFLRDGVEPDDAVLRKLRLLADDDGHPRVTVAGVLMATRDPQRWMPHAMIQAVAYAGERHDVAYQLDARDIGGTLDAQIRGGLHFVRRNMFVRATKATGRVEQPQFSVRAVFEALVNAVAHRDYAMAGARIRLHLFGDRLELHVPGGLADTLTPDSLHLRQYTRNELIVSLLARFPVDDDDGVSRSHLMDRRGDGVPIIQSETLACSGRPAEYEVIDDSEVRLRMWAAPAPV